MRRSQKQLREPGSRRAERLATKLDAAAPGTRRAERLSARLDRHVAKQAARDVETTRRRRSPEVARQELLDAAERVFATHVPDDVGLKDIAREAGTSHALITHYFGTYAGLIEATLQRRLNRLRETLLQRLQDATALSRPEELLGVLFATFDDPVHLRLMKRVVASERPAAIHALALQHQGLHIVAGQVASALKPQPSKRLVETIELALMTAVSAALGYAIAKYALAGAAGRDPGPALDEAVRKTLAEMVRGYLATHVGSP